MQTFRALLQQKLIERCRANPNYSLRSFARSLKVEPSSLSQILNGKRPITEKMKLRLGAALGMSAEEIHQIPLTENEVKTSQRKFQMMALDTFALISDWYHYAILELTYVQGFQANAAWIARRLGITKSEANIAIERLFRLELLKKDSKGRWIDASENGELTHLTPQMSSVAGRKYQAQLLELSKQALQEIALEKRNHTSATFCFDPADLPKATAKLTEMRRQFATEFQPKKKAKEVYQLQFSFFPLTKPFQKDDL